MNKEENNPNKCPICGRPTHKESKYCIFHASAEEKTAEEFKEALKEYIKKIKKEDKDYNFERFIFIGDINFKARLNIKIFKNANFMEAIFKGNVNFGSLTFKGNANFMTTTFERIANFGYTTFEGYVFFGTATFKDHPLFVHTIFKGHTDFMSTTFKGIADFLSTIFEGNVDFGSTTFKGDAFFKHITFKGDTNFRHTRFEGTAFFMSATFEGIADFVDTTFDRDAIFKVKAIKKNLNFVNIVFNQGKTLEINTLGIEDEVIVSFKKAFSEKIYLDLFLGEKTLIYFTTERIIQNMIINRKQIENHVFQEKRKEFRESKEVYLLLKNKFRIMGRYEDESWALKKEKDMERKSNYHFKSLHKWLWSCFLNAIYGYGEKPWNVILSAGILIFIFALLFNLIGIGNPEMIELKGTAIHQTSGNIVDLASKGLLKNNVTRNFPDSLYFSLITFTTLGYGDFRPLEGVGRILAGSEAFIGAFMMALFVYTFARRTGGR